MARPGARFRGVQSSGAAFDAKALARGFGVFKALARPSMPRPWRTVPGCSKLWRGLRCQSPGARLRGVQSSGAAFDAKALARGSEVFKALARLNGRKINRLDFVLHKIKLNAGQRRGF